MKKTVTLLMCVLFCFSVFACVQSDKTQSELWATAMYTEDTELGNGQKIVTVSVEAEGRSVVFILHTDAENLGDALVEHKLVAGEKSVYGLYIKKVNGMEADYNKTQTYWALNKNGESLATAADGEQIFGGEHYEIIYTK